MFSPISFPVLLQGMLVYMTWIPEPQSEVFCTGLTIAATKRMCTQMLLLLGTSFPVSLAMSLGQITAFRRYVTDAVYGIKDKKVLDTN